MSPEDPAPPIRPRFHMRPNILWPPERSREQPRVSCRSVHVCESNEWLLPAQMAGRTCAVVGSSAQHGFESKPSHLVGLRRLRWPSSQLRALETEEKILASRISNGNNVKKNHARTPRGKRRRVIACGDAFAELPRSVAAAAIVPFEDGLRGEGGKLVPLNCGEMPHAPCGLFALAPPSQTYP